MEVILFLVGFYGFFYLLGLIIEKVNEYREKEKSRVRDEVADAVITECGINEAVISDTKQHFDYVINNLHRRIGEQQEYEIKKPVVTSRFADNLCPKCGLGFLVRRQGQYGAFLGCSRYPNCKTTKPIGWVNQRAKDEIKRSKEDQKKEFAKMFMEDLGRAYK